MHFDDVRVFVQEEWRISSDKAGSGNTTNIGSIRGERGLSILINSKLCGSTVNVEGRG